MTDKETPTYNIHILIDEPYRDEVDMEDLEMYARRTLEAEGVPAGELTIVITDAERVRELNRSYRHVDATTDVLAFPMQEGETVPEEDVPYLGDVIIAYPVAKQQAREYGHSVQEELRLLAVHGILHLLGYDHATAEEEARMWARQDAILGKAYLEPGGKRRMG